MAKSPFVRAASSSAMAVSLALATPAQSPYPDLLYFKLDEGSGALTGNLAVPGVGSADATVHGHTLAASGGQFGGALAGAGGTGTTNFVDTGWITQLPGDFTLGFWLDLTALTPGNTFMYVFGDISANSFRGYTTSTGDAALRLGGSWELFISGGAATTAPHHVAWVYRASAGELRGYRDGVLAASATQPAATVSGAMSFRIGAFANNLPALFAGARIDEFRLYGSALSDAEIAATWDRSLFPPGPPQAFCTAGTTSNGCVPSISASGTPSASAASGFTLDVILVEGQKQGLIFYGVDNSGFTALPWGAGASFLCVKSPTQRTPPQGSGGAPSQCNGTLTLDWNAFRAAHAAALGQPFAAGQIVFAQAWFRDPPSPKTTNLSNGLRFTVGP